ncbi:mediator of RNA polymerase II transcription subunit 13 isoform X2 [Coccinella septempunctata]|uniref:mediator of RNA polymerase II transcription subunit 13 isoform X2 n=1 Tax=Coccinella septempunctata TaxID=41139 RepID=UPI001D061028|nr:mediator of RNA polymerase II transcription subunit 13 isoform X2 [Coccinella septempunctata]
MTHPNFQTNGASLEDCHTNFFALTELSGIKWRKLVWCEGSSGGPPGPHGPSEPLDDPVLRSYARCLAADILCVWRRVSTPRQTDVFELGPPPPSQPPPLNLSASKELWIFWYGEEPDLNELVAPELNVSDGEQGSWESGLSYKCRSLLFKALHNLIERCLLSRDFIRLGKWFVQPYTGPKKPTTQQANGTFDEEAASMPTANASNHLSFSFAFFVHGESTVCASVDVRQHPPVRRLTRAHIHQAQASNGTKVILAPFGLCGTLMGPSFKSADSSARLLDEWSQFYPVDRSLGLSESSVVEVVVGGVKMRYPSCYVLVTDIDDAPQTTPETPPPHVPTPTPGTDSNKNETNTPILVPTPPPSPVPINSKVPQPGPYQVSTEHMNSMCREATAASILTERTWQECVLGGPPGANGPAGPSSEFNGNWDLLDPTKRVGCACSKCPPAFSQQEGGPLSYPRTQESMAVPSVGSPPSVAPSPLPNPHSQQPASVPPGEPLLPTLSPHPTNPSPFTKSYTPPEQPAKTPAGGASEANSPQVPPPSVPEVKTEALQGGGQSVGGGGGGLLKRPLLTSKDYEAELGEEEQSLEMLYDYSTMNAWLNHPVKRYKPSSKENLRNSNKNDIYSMYTHNGMSNASYDMANNVNVKTQPYVKQELNQEQRCSGEGDASMVPGMSHGIKRPGDPYEFDEEGGGSSCNMDGFKRGGPGSNIKEEPKDAKKTNLFTSEGLQPSYKDLDQIFDNSDDTSSDEAMQIQTPPGSTFSGGHEDSKRFSGGHSSTSSGGCPTIGILRPEELSKMFPTPPSLEHNPMPSPCGLIDTQTPDFTDLTQGVVRIKQEIYPNMGSPPEEHIDWSYVFKPPVMCKIVGSSKYAPLTNLPSQGLPVMQLPPHCVYKPSWLQMAEKQAQAQQQQQTQTPAAQTTATPAQQQTSSNHHQTNAVPMANPLTPVATPNPTIVPGGTGTPHHQPSGINPFSPAGFRPPPPPYELPSPATSNASSYLNKNLNSVEAVQTPSVQRAPEASALLLNILLTDTAFNIFRDHNFESCTLCVCNGTGNIRGSDAAVYLMNGDGPPHHGPYHGSHHLNNGLHNPDSPYPGAMMGQPPPYGMMSPNHHGQGHSVDDSIRCSCGFSAVVNRRLAYGSGLFYEDEKEITGLSREPGSMIRVVPGIADDPAERKKTSLSSYLVSTNSLKTDANVDRDQIDGLPHYLLELIRDQCGVIPNNVNALCRAADFIKTQRGVFSNTVNVLEYSDSNEVTAVALDQSRQASADALGSCKMEEAGQRHNNQRSNKMAVHKWPFLRACGPQCNQDIVRVMKGLRPLLQDAIQKKCQTRLWEAPSAVKGPLTWRQFHRLAGRGTDDRCEPQPIPSLVVGHEKDWLSLSPYALHHWETLLLEPYSYSRDVAYIVVAPDNDSILPRVRWFFKELSTAYEMCKLGRHSPITKVLRDGILRVGKTAKAKIGNEAVEEWFTMLGESETTDMLKLYAQVCKHHLAPHLQQVPMDKTLLDPPPEPGDKPAPSPMPPPSTPDGNSQHSAPPEKAPATPKSPADLDGTKEQSASATAASAVDLSHDEEEREVPCVVIYLVEPFSMGSDQPELQRLACLALLRCFQSVLAAVPDNIRNNINVQIISLESIVELGRSRDRTKHSDHMRALSLNIFSQCRRLLIHTNNVKSLTGFGTAAQADVFLKSKDEKNRAPYKMYTPPYILAPMREKVEAVESFGKGTGDQASVLYLSYCLSEDQSWLLAVATDERGEILENITINIDIPNRSRRKKASARRIGLEKLMNFIIGVLSQSARPWRLVVGRLGRIGHGELKGWSWLLSKKNLLKASQHLKELCTQCSLMYPSSVPCILSACLVSLEPDTTLRLMPDEFTPDERFSQVSVNSQLSTPQDVSCTHILVFPTSATTQSSQTAFQEQHITPELGDEEIFIALNDDMPECIDGMNDFSDIFNWTDSGAGGGQSPNGSPRREESGPGSPGGCGNNMGRQGSPYQSGNNKMGDPDQTEEVGTLLQQPLALGYLVSTAPTGKMPKWFWSQCPHLEGVCPAFLKNALHLHSPNVQQSSDDLFQQSAVTSHPLDSTYTTDVLRYVLEGYNALSWLALDSNTKDRLSCLPVHMQVLVQLYHTTAALI